MLNILLNFSFDGLIRNDILSFDDYIKDNNIKFYDYKITQQKFCLIAGLSAVGTDFITYYIMLNFLHHDIAKILSFEVCESGRV